MSVEALRNIPLHAEEDPVESFLSTLDWKGEDPEEDDDGEYIDLETVEVDKTVVGDWLHGPTIDNELKEERPKVRSTSANPANPTNR